MNAADRRDYIKRYEQRLREFGYSAETLGWGKHGRQRLRFGILADHALRMPNSSVLDVGCGFADLYEFLIEHGWRGRYTGLDIVPGLLEVARRRHPEADLREVDITGDDVALDMYDFVVASGMFNAKLRECDNEKHIIQGLTAMLRHARVAVCLDFMSTHVDFQKPGSWHTDPGWALNAGKQLSRRVWLRHDYMPFEFSLCIFRDDAVSERNVFSAVEAIDGKDRG